jgi:hypothetical protein
MATVITSFDFHQRGPRSSYPWQTWMDGQIRVAKRGVDFNVTAEQFRSTILLKSKIRGAGGTAFTSVVDPDTVVFQIIPAGRPASAVRSFRTASKKAVIPAMKAAESLGGLMIRLEPEPARRTSRPVSRHGAQRGKSASLKAAPVRTGKAGR